MTRPIAASASRAAAHAGPLPDQRVQADLERRDVVLIRRRSRHGSLDVRIGGRLEVRGGSGRPAGPATHCAGARRGARPWRARRVVERRAANRPARPPGRGPTHWRVRRGTSRPASRRALAEARCGSLRAPGQDARARASGSARRCLRRPRIDSGSSARNARAASGSQSGAPGASPDSAGGASRGRAAPAAGGFCTVAIRFISATSIRSAAVCAAACPSRRSRGDAAVRRAMTPAACTGWRAADWIRLTISVMSGVVALGIEAASSSNGATSRPGPCRMPAPVPLTKRRRGRATA